MGRGFHSLRLRGALTLGRGFAGSNCFARSTGSSKGLCRSSALRISEEQLYASSVECSLGCPSHHWSLVRQVRHLAPRCNPRVAIKLLKQTLESRRVLTRLFIEMGTRRYGLAWVCSNQGDIPGWQRN
jgi:hypothetical protein